MDVQTGLVCVGIVVVSAAAILFISTMGTRGKSFEEAIAEQRKLPDDLLLNKKDKNKEKKHKNKAGKKVKEKKEEKDDKDDKVEHVHKETPQTSTPEPSVQESNKGNKKKGKLEKIKPILVNKDEPLVIVNELGSSQSPLAEANHFDVIHPKDDLELLRSQSGENFQQITHADTVVNKSPKDTPTRSKRNNKDNKDKKKDESAKDEKQDSNTHPNPHSSSSSIYKETSKEVKEQQKETPIKEVKEVVKEIVQQASSKEPRKTKKKNDILALMDGDAVNVELLMLCIQKAQLSRTEIQILTDQLLNKQQDNPLEHSEWTEGRADPVIKLKKQLAEKEKTLADEHEASVALQNKLKELRAEFNLEKSRLSANLRLFEDSLNNKMTETQTLHTRMQHILESHAAEKQGFARQIEQLQSKVNEDSTIIHKLQEDQGQTQGHLQQELMAQRKQMEVQFAQMRENENALKTQLAQKHVEVQELQNELQATCDSSTGEIEMLRQQMGMMQNQLIHSDGQLQLLKEANDRLQDVTRQLEESHRVHADLEHRLKSAHRHEQELQKQVNSMQAELTLTKNEANEAPTLKTELCKVQTEMMKLKTELSASINEAKAEATEITMLKNTLSNKEDELKTSQDELVAMQNELQQSKTLIPRMESKLSLLQNELDIMKIEFKKADSVLIEAKADASSRQNEVQRLQETLADVQAELANARAQIGESNEAASQVKTLQAEITRLKCSETKAEKLQRQLTILQQEHEAMRVKLTDHIVRQLQQQKEEMRRLVENSASTDSSAEKQRLETQLKTLQSELTHKTDEINRLNTQVQVLTTDANEYKTSIQTLEEAMENQRSKNNDLRIKNWKVMEALTEAQSRNNTFNNGIEITTQKIKEEQEEITKALLQRIFPDIKISEKIHEQWLEAFEAKVHAALNEPKQKNTDETISDLEKQNKNQQGMIMQYKQIITETEGMLNRLQKDVESEETRWKSQLRQKENEVTNLKIELNDMKAKLIADKEVTQKAKEVDHLQQNCKSAQVVPTLKEFSSKELVILEQLQEEKARLSQELEVECNKRATLDAEVTKLRSLVETSEASLAFEKNLVTQLQQEVVQLKNEICGGCSSSEQSMLNGPPTSDSLQSEPPLASQALITALESTLLKNAEFANCSISKPVHLVSQSEQEIENSPLTTKYSSKSCHMTDHKTQANWNPMIGQQHKKNKKKRKVKNLQI